MDVVAARLGGDVDDATACLAVFGGVGRGLNRELLDRLRREADNFACDADAGIVYAVGEHHGAAGASAVHAEVEPGHRLTGSDVGVFAPGDARDIRCGESQVKHAAIKQRNVLHLTRGDGLRLRAGLGVQDRRLGFD